MTPPFLLLRLSTVQSDWIYNSPEKRQMTPKRTGPRRTLVRTGFALIGPSAFVYGRGAIV